VLTEPSRRGTVNGDGAAPARTFARATEICRSWAGPISSKTRHTVHRAILVLRGDRAKRRISWCCATKSAAPILSLPTRRCSPPCPGCCPATVGDVLRHRGQSAAPAPPPGHPQRDLAGAEYHQSWSKRDWTA